MSTPYTPWNRGQFCLLGRRNIGAVGHKNQAQDSWGEMKECLKWSVFTDSLTSRRRIKLVWINSVVSHPPTTHPSVKEHGVIGWQKQRRLKKNQSENLSYLKTCSSPSSIALWILRNLEIETTCLSILLEEQQTKDWQNPTWIRIFSDFFVIL